jgi:hypothetical protein
MEKISMKQKIDPQRIVRVLHVKENGLKIMVDDDVVRELPDGQDMVVEISEASAFDNAVANSSDHLNPAVEVKLATDAAKAGFKDALSCRNLSAQKTLLHLQRQSEAEINENKKR